MVSKYLPITIFNGLVDLINMIIVPLTGIALVLFLTGMVRFIYRSDSVKNRNRDRSMITWGLTALFVLVSIWGILNFLLESFLPPVR